VREARGLAPVARSRRADGIAEIDPRDHAAAGDHASERLQERHLAHVREVRARRAVRVLVAHGRGMDDRRVRDRRLEERRVERQQAVAFRRGALGEESHAVALRERLVHARVDARRIVPARALHE